MNQNNKLYHIEYQILVKEPEYNKLCQTTQIISENPRGRFEFEFIPKTFYGRTNILYFKLCHNYCDSCIELGISEIDQKYFNYSENYIYDYFYYLEKIIFYVYLKDIYIIMKHV